MQQGLEALGRNLAETGRRSGQVDKEVGEALGRAALSMQETMEAMGDQSGSSGPPIEEARRTVEALNRLALALLQNGEQVGNSSGNSGRDPRDELSELARRQGALSGQANSLLPMDLGARALNEELEQLAREQAEIARKLGGMNNGPAGADDFMGQLDQLAAEAAQLARDLGGGRLTPELLARQERLFHRLLDAGHTMEREETSPERLAERPGAVEISSASELDPSLLDGGLRYRVPGPEVLRRLPPAYRRLVLDYFDRLNQAAAAAPGGERGAGGEGGAR